MQFTAVYLEYLLFELRVAAAELYELLDDEFGALRLPRPALTTAGTKHKYSHKAYNVSHVFSSSSCYNRYTHLFYVYFGKAKSTTKFIGNLNKMIIINKVSLCLYELI